MNNGIKKLTRKEKPSYWQKQVSAWRASGLSQAQFCRDNNLKVRDFGYWKRKFSGSSDSVRFVPLQVKSSAIRPSSSLCLVLESGLRIEVREGFSPCTLKELVLTLRAL